MNTIFSSNLIFNKSYNKIFRTCIISGMCRVGKTLLGNIISTIEKVEYSEEPWFLQIMPIIQKNSNIDEKIIIEMISAYTLELYKDTFLLRAANFRPNDLSYIGNKKTIEEINFRLNNVNRLSDVIKYGNDHIFIINLAETFTAYNIIKKAINNLKLIYITRHPYNVAEEIQKKQWFSNNELLNPSMASPFIEYSVENTKWYLPWWVPFGYEDFFLSLSDFDRCIYYWTCMSNSSIDLVLSKDENIYHITYEDFTISPEKYFFEISEFLNIKGRNITNEKLNNIYTTPIYNGNISNIDLKEICINTIKNLNYGYKL